MIEIEETNKARILSSREIGTSTLQSGERAVPHDVAYCVVTLTASEVNDIAEEVRSLPERFEPVSWLEENYESIATLATAAVRDIVIEALEIGLADHPLVLRGQRAAASKTLH